MTAVDDAAGEPTRRAAPSAEPAARACCARVAAAHQHAHRADAAVPARPGRVPGSLLPQRSVNVENGQRLLRRRTRRWRRCWTGSCALRRLRLALVRRRSTCCCSSRWSAAWCPGCASTLRDAACARRRRAPARLDRLPQRDRAVDAAGARRRRRRRGGAAPARAGAVRRRDGAVTVARREGLPQGDRQPALPLRRCSPLLVGVALGSWYGWHGNRLLVAGRGHGLLQHPASSTTSTGSAPRRRRGRPAAVLRDAGRLHAPSTSTTGSRSRSPPT